MKRALALTALVCAGCATSPKRYASFDDVAYEYEREATVWAPTARLNIHVARLGDPRSSAPPLVLLHPWGFSMLVWKDVAAELAKERLVVLVDLPGHGKSDKVVTQYTMARLAAAVLDVTRDLPPFFVAGNSLGGATALAMAEAAPERLRGLVLVAAPGGHLLPEPLRHAARTIATHDSIETLSDEAWLIGLIVAERSDGPLANRLMDDIVALKDAREWPAWCRSTSLVLGTVAEYAPDLTRIEVPTLVVHGDNDFLIGGGSEALAAGLPNAELEIVQGCGHMLEVECPDALRAHIEGFVRGGASEAP